MTLSADELRSRVLSQARATPSPSRRVQRRRATVALLGAMLALAACHFFARGAHPQERPDLIIAQGCALLLGVALLASAFVARAGTQAPLPFLRLGFAVLVLLPVSALVPLGSDAEVSARAHLGCGLFTWLFGLVPVAALLYCRRRGDPFAPGLTAASAGLAGLSISGMVVFLNCELSGAIHLLVGHALSIVAGVVLAWLIGRRIVTP